MSELLRISLLWVGSFSFVADVFGKDPNDRAWAGWSLVEQPGCSLFDGLSQREELSRPGAAFGTLHSSKFIHSGIADLAEHDFVVTEH